MPYYCNCFFCLLSHVIWKMISWWKNFPDDNEYNFGNYFIVWKIWHSLYTDWFLTWQWFMIYQRKHPANENALWSLCICIMSLHLMNMHKHSLFHRLSCAHICQQSWHSRHAISMPSMQGFHGSQATDTAGKQHKAALPSTPGTHQEVFTLGFSKYSSTTAVFIIMYRQRERGREEKIYSPKLQLIWLLVSGKNNLTEHLWEVRYKLEIFCLSGDFHYQHQGEEIPTAFISWLLYW